jgi:hypothetical protein
VNTTVKTKVNIVLFEDYVWDLNESGIKFDEKFEVEKLGWQPGDYFKLVLAEGGLKLVKIDDLEKFIIKGKDHEANDRQNDG